MGNNVNQPAFMPASSGTVNITATVASANVAITSTKFQSMHVQVVNTGSVTAFIEFGEASVAASITTSMPILPGTCSVYRCPSTHVAAITASGTAALYFSPGEGL